MHGLAILRIFLIGSYTHRIGSYTHTNLSKLQKWVSRRGRALIIRSNCFINVVYLVALSLEIYSEKCFSF